MDGEVAQARGASRLPYLDNLRVLLVIGVIAVHSVITYGFDRVQ